LFPDAVKYPFIFPVNSLFLPLLGAVPACWLLETPSACASLLGLVLVGAVAVLGVVDGAADALLGLHLVRAVGAFPGLHLVGAAAFLGGLNFVEVLAGA
jgi:hypothetical protein